jgi:Zn-dependent protease
MKQIEILNWVMWGAFYALIAVNIFALNVVMHEIGHYVPAEYYDLEPKMEFSLQSLNDSLEFSLDSKPVASTTFLRGDSTLELAVITLMGPFMNLFFALVFLTGFLLSKRYVLKDVSIIGFVLSFTSFVMNMIPISGTDGAHLLGL